MATVNKGKSASRLAALQKCAAASQIKAAAETRSAKRLEALKKCAAADRSAARREALMKVADFEINHAPEDAALIRKGMRSYNDLAGVVDPAFPVGAVSTLGGLKLVNDATDKKRSKLDRILRGAGGAALVGGGISTLAHDKTRNAVRAGIMKLLGLING